MGGGGGGMKRFLLSKGAGLDKPPSLVVTVGDAIFLLTDARQRIPSTLGKQKRNRPTAPFRFFYVPSISSQVTQLRTSLAFHSNPTSRWLGM